MPKVRVTRERKSAGRTAKHASDIKRKSAAGHGARAIEVRRKIGFNREDFSRMLASSVRSLATIEAGSKPSAPLARRLTEIRRVTEALAEVQDPRTIGEWLKTPNPAFDGLKPLEVIERGEIDRIWQMIHLLRSGAPS